MPRIRIRLIPNRTRCFNRGGTCRRVPAALGANIGGRALLAALFSAWLLVGAGGAGAEDGPVNPPSTENEPAADGATVEYVRDVKPLLVRCHACHGALEQESDLRLDTPAMIRKGGANGAAIVPGNAAESLLVMAIMADEAVSAMPPDGEGARLTTEEIDVIRRWIDAGAAAEDEPLPADPREHWAFIPPVRPEPPVVSRSAWVANPIDAFVAAEHEARGLTPVAAAPKRLLLRRIYLDLIGLPPTRDELHAFVKDESPDAYDRVVRRLLESPQYGERWGRHWMDVWRYSDWAGYGAEIRESQPHIWRWRDWIVESLNDDKPYDRMLIEMLAGDELAPADPNTLRATGFLGRNWYKFNRNVWLENTVEHTSKAMLGVTMNCSKCHDHKYDPIPQADFYRMRAFFEPYDVRLDRVPGQADTNADGLARVYDKDAAVQTFVFIRGNEAMPDKDQAVAPAVPPLLLDGESLAIDAVNLPPEAYYPALQPFVVDESLAAARTAVSNAETKLAETEKAAAESTAAGKVGDEGDATASGGAEAAEKTPNDATSDKATPNEPVASEAAAPEPAAKTPPDDRQLAAAALDAARRELESLEARIASERAKHFKTADEAAEAELARTAARAERQAKLVRAEYERLDAERKSADAQSALAANAEDDKLKKGAEEAQKKFDAAVKAVEAATAEAAKEDANYSPLGPIYPATSSGRRLALARWIADRRNPLTARVAVNHIWLRHFGRPLVPSVFDFGNNGREPSHPKLLDWLAVELMDNGWSMKHLHRLIVSSNTYRMSSSAADGPFDSADPADPADQANPTSPTAPTAPTNFAGANRSVDPDNIYLWRANVRRAEAEVVRDCVLFVGGDLDPAMGGPEIDQNAGQTSRRRSIYFRHAKEKQMTMLKVFDGPGVAECYERDESIVPQQALALANSVVAKTQSRRLARSLSELEPASSNDGAFVEAAYETILSRSPTPEELAACASFLAEQTKLLSDPSKLTAATVGEAAQLAPSTDPKMRARENLTLVLMNHSDFVTIR